ncbi:MAG: response regulator [Armatimonadota bacterium]|nr:response regulator [Armatimonadota bacterium]MDR7463890.1 response regulator [Armatimonadota bacterium]MDR7470060.1 response regulator [Armatimonadota bacterium]MDR7474418.1 response regulator [Armatimonadota bacterium]MDR7538246.1 response regulator [Armatimonadota bacterium]
MSVPFSPGQEVSRPAASAVLRVIIADAYPATREVIGQVLAADSRFLVVGSVGTMEEAVRLIREAQPDILLVDPWLSGPAGLPACVAAKQFRPGMLLVALLPEEREEYIRAAQALGADASLQKRLITRDLMPVLREVTGARGR